MKPKPHVSEKKKKQIKELEKLFIEWPIIGIVDMSSLPGAQLQKIRNSTKKDFKILMAKKRLIKLAIENIKDKKKNIAELENYLEGIPALIFTKLNPFKLYSLVQKNKSNAPIKPGQLAPRDIVIPPGPTPFAPGPMIGEFTSMGIKSGVEAGKIAIKQEFSAAKEGQPVDAKIAGLLMKLGMEPMEIGLNVKAVYEDGDIFKKDVLAVDEKEYFKNIVKAASWAFNLAVEAGYPTKQTIKLMLMKAARETKALAREAGIPTRDNVGELLSKAEAQASSLKAGLDI